MYMSCSRIVKFFLDEMRQERNQRSGESLCRRKAPRFRRYNGVYCAMQRNDCRNLYLAQPL